MLHELGHYNNKDLDKEEVSTQENLYSRAEAVLAGRVQEEELKADAFAIRHVGKNTFMRSMDYMIRMRKKRGDSSAELAIKEFELGKKAAQNMK